MPVRHKLSRIDWYGVGLASTKVSAMNTPHPIPPRTERTRRPERIPPGDIVLAVIVFALGLTVLFATFTSID